MTELTEDELWQRLVNREPVPVGTSTVYLLERVVYQMAQRIELLRAADGITWDQARRIADAHRNEPVEAPLTPSEAEHAAYALGYQEGVDQGKVQALAEIESKYHLMMKQDVKDEMVVDCCGRLTGQGHEPDCETYAAIKRGDAVTLTYTHPDDRNLRMRLRYNSQDR